MRFPLPTNTKEKWYREFHAYSQDFTSVELKESRDTKWVAFNISIECGDIAPKPNEKTYISNHFLKLDIFEIVTNPSIKKFTTYVMEEDIQKFYATSSLPTKLHKKISIVFSRQILDTNFESEIRLALHKIIQEINSEARKVKSDILHKGSFISAQNIWFSQQESFWSCSGDSLRSSDKVYSEPEFWEGISFVSDYITWTAKFPWLRNEISIEEFPF